MLASAHFRREGVGPGCSDSPGPPGACPTQATAAAAAAAAVAAALCCLRTPRALHVGTAKTEQEDATLAAPAQSEPCVFLEACLHDSCQEYCVPFLHFRGD